METARRKPRKVGTTRGTSRTRSSRKHPEYEHQVGAHRTGMATPTSGRRTPHGSIPCRGMSPRQLTSPVACPHLHAHPRAANGSILSPTPTATPGEVSLPPYSGSKASARDRRRSSWLVSSLSVRTCMVPPLAGEVRLLRFRLYSSRYVMRFPREPPYRAHPTEPGPTLEEAPGLRSRAVHGGPGESPPIGQ